MEIEDSRKVVLMAVATSLRHDEALSRAEQKLLAEAIDKAVYAKDPTFDQAIDLIRELETKGLTVQDPNMGPFLDTLLDVVSELSEEVLNESGL